MSFSGDPRDIYHEIGCRLALQRHFSNWRDFVERTRIGEKKADYYFRFNQLERVFNVWKRMARAASERRGREERARNMVSRTNI